MGGATTDLADGRQFLFSVAWQTLFLFARCDKLVGTQLYPLAFAYRRP